MENAHAVYGVLQSLGFDDESCSVYASLWENGPQTISELSRSSGVERTKVYRVLPVLQDALLVDIDKEYAHDIIRIAPPDNLQDILDKQQGLLYATQRTLPALIAARAGDELEKSRVNVYRGTSGLKQLLWNETNAKSELLSILKEPIQSNTNSAFFERWVAKRNERGLTSRSVFGDAFRPSYDRWYQSHDNERLRTWEGRHISDDIFAVDQNMVIYDDVVAYFVWNSKEAFGVEIHNELIAKTQRQFFDLLWKAAE